MGLAVMKNDAASPAPASVQAMQPVAKIVALPRPQPGLLARLRPVGIWLATNVLPPALMLGLLLLLWQILCARPGATLPAPSVIWAQAHDLIVSPFFNFGSQDIGLGWRVLVSLQRDRKSVV